jgi:flavin-dependent dehydrogenase
MYDAIVVGGGPAGATTATRLAQAGRRVVLLERESFPRFHIGESLLPCSVPLFKKLGVGDAIASAGFLPKHAAEFVTADGSLARRYPFADGLVRGIDSAYEVDRERFDEILLDNARKQGVEVRQPAEVRSFDIGAHRVDVELRTGDTLSGQVLVDATGQRSLVAGRLGLRQMDAELKNFAIYSHFEGAKRGSGDREGDITIVLVPDGWWWVIPLAGGRTSLGKVAPSRALGGRRADESYLDDELAATPYLRERFAGAKRSAPVRTTSDYSYRSTRFVGDRWLLCGDAAAFLDPVFSSGVYLANAGGFRAAEAIDRALSRGRLSRRSFRPYERWLEHALGTYRQFVRGFYSPEFVEILMRPSDALGLRKAVTSLLAGEVDRFSIAWRIWVLHAIVRANRDWNLAPRIEGRREAAARFDREA